MVPQLSSDNALDSAFSFHTSLPSAVFAQPFSTQASITAPYPSHTRPSALSWLITPAQLHICVLRPK